MKDPATSSGLDRRTAFGTESLGAILIEHFTVVAEAFGGSRRLRELAIELAVRGLLLGKTDRTSWQPVVLADVVTDLQNGISKRRGDAGDAVPVLRLADIDGGVRIRNKDLREIVLTREEQEKYRVENGDILVIRVNGSADLVGRFVPCLISRNWAYSDHLIRVRLNTERINPAFLCTLARSAAARAHLVAKTVTTAGQRTINQGGLGTLPFVLPPLAEQKRIVAKVNQLMALCDELEARQTKKRETSTRLTKSALQALTTAESPEDFDRAWKRVVDNFDVLVDRSEKLEELRRVIFGLAIRGTLTQHHQAVPPTIESSVPFGLPALWSWQALATLGATQTGSTPSTKESSFWGGEVPFVAPGDIDEPSIGVAAKSLTLAGAAHARMIPANSVLMVCIGGSLGKVGVARHAICCNQQINAITPGPDVEGEFLAVVLRSPYFKREAWTRALQGTLPIINKSKWEEILVPVPPIAEQKRIITCVDHLMKVCDELEARLIRAEERASKLVEAVVQDLVA